MVKDFLPISKKDMKKRGWEQCDFVYVIGDAYVDHSSFGPAIISRLLEAFGYKVGIIAQPDWKDKNSIAVLGAPRLGFLVSAGNMDSMVNHYTVSKKHRKTDSFSPGGVMGRRPDYATVVYCNLIRQTFKKEPIIGIMKKTGAGNCVPLPMRLLYSAEEKFTGGKHDFKVQCETSLYRACGSCAGHRARCGLVVKNDDRSASGYEFSVCDGCHNRYGSKSGTGGK
jgi:hypothetical protein